ncbi:MAG: hypothetical protein K2H59_08325 [Muribaculaceae bacterium]|nr:hypothetical protein [Muribaculaceae bacterium]
MIKKFTLTTIILIFFSAFNILAENEFDENDMDADPQIEIKENPENPGTGRPRSANRQHVYCNYTNGVLVIQFAISEGNCELIVIETETGDSKIYYFNSFSPAFINIGNLNSFELFITTEKGNSYYGNK